MPEERPPRVGLRFLLRAFGAAVLIVLCTAGAVATAGLLAIKSELTPPRDAPPPLETREITKAEAGEPQTILVLGSDRRYGEGKGTARSDTIMLVRLDPDQQATAVLSIPRDLKVEIRGHGTDKINAAYSIGGPNLTARTVKDLLNVDIHHIVNVNFRGFREAVTALGCVYVDVDRRYYHSNAGLPQTAHYAEIDIDPGYQRLCGQKALDYVRFRHADSDIVRAARQQDFLRAAKDQISSSALIDKHGELIDIFQSNAQTDKDLRSFGGALRLIKLAIYSSGHPVREIPFPAQFAGDAATGQFVVASADGVARVRRQFLHATPAAKPRRTAGLTRQAKRAARNPTSGARLRDARRDGEALFARPTAPRRLTLPVYVPRKLTPEGYYTNVAPSPRLYTLRDRSGRKHPAYRLVVVQNETEGQYYGVQGTTWRRPPALAHPTGRIRVRGRTLQLFRDGSRLRYVAWVRKDVVVWVSNSLSLGLTNAQMLGIAGSLARFRP